MITQIKEVSLKDILSAREQRAEKQRNLIGRFKSTLISFTVNIPGNQKETPLSKKIFDEGVTALKKSLELRGMNIIYEEVCYKFTGPEAFILVDENEFEVKKISVEVEEVHPIGRLFDIDIFDMECNPIQRDSIKKDKRKCLICEEPAYNCVRSRRHTLEELLVRIKEITDGYFINAD